MPRRARITLANVPHHIIQRGNNRSACFYMEDDYSTYLDWLQKYARENDCCVHAYVLMTNHVHLLVTPTEASALASMMKSLGQRYVQYINRQYGRSGTLWEGRYKSCIVSEESYLLGCYRYIELNPVRAGMVRHPAEYQWSSYRTNAQGEVNTLIQPHDLYLRLGATLENRTLSYRELFKAEMSSDIVNDIRTATNGNYALGSERFCSEVEAMIGRRVTPGQPGRPVFTR